MNNDGEMKAAEERNVSAANSKSYRYGGKEYTKENIAAIAKFQSFVLYSVVFNLAVSVLSGVGIPQTVAGGLFLLCALFCIYSVFSLRNAEKENIALTIVAVLLLFIPVLSLVIMLFSVLSATRILKAAGLKVGFMGVSREELEKFNTR